MYEYVPRSLIMPWRKVCEQILKDAQMDLRIRYGLRSQPVLIGSGAAGLVTRNGTGPFDLDYNLVFTSVPDRFLSEPEYLKNAVRIALDHNIREGFSYGQDSHASITYLKMEGSKVMFSFDVALILKGQNGRPDSRLIHDKGQGRYIWNEIRGSEDTLRKTAELRKAGQTSRLRKLYLTLKNENLSQQTDKPSYVIYMEAVNLAWQSYNKEVRTMSKVSGKTHTAAQMNHHANQNNPNNPAHTAAQNNHANQCNPNNPAYQGSKGKGKK